MVIDHTGEFFPQTPVWFRWIGRISAPLFFYCSAWGFYYTHSQKQYLIRLYLLGLLMSVGNIIIFLSSGKKMFISNNIFPTLFLGCMLVFLFERQKAVAGNVKPRLKYLALFITQQIVAFLLCAAFAELLQIPDSVDIYMLYYAYGALFGSTVFTEGSIWFVLFFVGVYFFKKQKTCLSIFTLFFSAFLEFLIRRTSYMRGLVSYLVPFNNFQWLMVFVIPCFWIYNGRKGNGSKVFYYLAYPLHIWMLYVLSQTGI